MRKLMLLVINICYNKRKFVDLRFYVAQNADVSIKLRVCDRRLSAFSPKTATTFDRSSFSEDAKCPLGRALWRTADFWIYPVRFLSISLEHTEMRIRLACALSMYQPILTSNWTGEEVEGAKESKHCISCIRFEIASINLRLNKLYLILNRKYSLYIRVGRL